MNGSVKLKDARTSRSKEQREAGKQRGKCIGTGNLELSSKDSKAGGEPILLGQGPPQAFCMVCMSPFSFSFFIPLCVRLSPPPQLSSLSLPLPLSSSLFIFTIFNLYYCMQERSLIYLGALIVTQRQSCWIACVISCICGFFFFFLDLFFVFVIMLAGKLLQRGNLRKEVDDVFVDPWCCRAHNMIHTISQEALQALPHLETLYLNHNRIMDIPIGAFPSPSRLTGL